MLITIVYKINCKNTSKNSLHIIIISLNSTFLSFRLALPELIFYSADITNHFEDNAVSRDFWSPLLPIFLVIF